MAVFFIGCKPTSLKIEIDGHFEGKVFLINASTYETDTIAVINSSVSILKEDLTEPALFLLAFEDINSIHRPLYVILSNEKTDLSFSNLKKVNEQSQIIAELYPNWPTFINDPNRNEVLYHYLDVWITFVDSVSLPQMEIDDRKRLYFDFIEKSKAILKEESSEYVGAVILDFLRRDNLLQLDELQSQYDLLSDAVKKSPLGMIIGDEVGFAKLTAAPEFKLIDSHGTVFNLRELQGKKVLLHFWSSTCAPCVKEIPILAKLAVDNPDVQIINISLDRDSLRWISAVERFGLVDMANYCDGLGFDGDIVTDYHIRGIPANYLIDEEGRIIAKKQSVKDILSEI